jgi:hypothetical protein
MRPRSAPPTDPHEPSKAARADETATSTSVDEAAAIEAMWLSSVGLVGSNDSSASRHRPSMSI